MAGPGAARFYSSTFVQTSLASGISAGATSYNVGTTTGAPGTPFVVSVDQNSATEELMLVTNVSGLTYTVTRGVGGTSAVSHSTGASVVHVMYAQDLTDAGGHIGSFDAVHGLSSGSLVVGTTDTQTLTNKTLTTPTITTPSITSPTITGTTTAGVINSAAITSTAEIKGVDFNPTGLTGAVAASRYVGATASGAPASGTFAVGDHIVDQAGLLWVCTVAGTPGTWISMVNTSAAQTLTNKTINAGVFTGAGTGSGSINLSSFMLAAEFIASGKAGATNASTYAGATASGAPTSGTFALGDFIIDLTGVIWICTAAGTPGTWTTYSNPRLPLAPISSSANGTATVGTTETFDAVLGNYAPTLSTGRRYRVTLGGLVGNGSVAGDVFVIQIRDGGASAPTSSSTMICQAQWPSAVAGTVGRMAIPLEATFTVASSGVHTLGVSATRQSGTGVFTPVNSTAGFRELYVSDIT